MQKLLIASALVLFPAAAHAEDWALVSVADDRGGAMFVDADSIKPVTGEIRSARILAVLLEDDGPYAAALGEIEVDCGAHKQRFRAIWPYDSAGKPGTKEGGTDWTSPHEGTLYDHSLRTICGEKPLSTRRFGAAPPIAAARALMRNEDSGK